MIPTSRFNLSQVVVRLSVGLAQVVLCSGEAMAASGDNFDDNSKDASRWGADQTVAHGMLTEKNHRLEYTVSGGMVEDDAWRPWILTRFPYNANWDIQFDVFNNSNPSSIVQVNSLGILILTTRTDTNDIYAELYSSALGSLPARTGFSTQLETGDDNVGGADSEGGNGVTNAAIRVAFESTNKVLTISYDTDISNGYQWVQQATFGVAGAGGADGNTDWAMTDTDQFAISLYGYSAFMNIPTGQMYADNFLENGGVTPSAAPSPDPLGNFSFGFPLDNPLLTRIVDITGNYQGITPTAAHRNYNIDVAQDESGKLLIMGTMDGILDKNGSPDISGKAGAIQTVNKEPAAEIKGSFTGTRDGVSASFSGSAVAPVEVTDIGGGTNGFTGTGSYRSKIGGIPYSGKNQPFQVASPPGATNNLKQDWSVQLDISRKNIKRKTRTVASAQLTLPNGDLITYPDKVVKYSAKKGYVLSFSRGTNVTVNPPAIDPKSKISITGLMLTQSGTNWVPTAGTINYQFNGQKGTANLMDFETP